MNTRRWISAAQRLTRKIPFIQSTDKTISLDFERLGLLLPFHIVLRDGRAKRIGPSLLRCLEQADAVDSSLHGLLELIGPDDLVHVDWQRPELLLDRPLELQTHSGHAFCAELQPLPPHGWLLVLQPIAQSIQDLHGYGLTLQDLSLSDPLRQHVLPALLNEGLQELLLHEASLGHTSSETEADAAAWLGLQLEN
jgi:hypothetical protein